MFESALYHGNYSLRLCKDNNIRDFDLAFGYESVASAYMVGKNKELMKEYLQLTKNATENMNEKGNKDYFYLN